MSYVGDIFKAVAPTLVGFGTGMIMNNQARQQAKGQANKEQELLNQQYQIALQNEKNLKLMQQSGQGTPEKEKSNLPLYIGLGVGGVVILGVVIFAVTRNKS